MKKYAAAPMMDRTAGPNQATANQGSAFLNPRGLMTLFLKPSPVTRRVISTPMAGKNMAAPVTNCAATGGMPVSAPDDTGYTTPNSYAHVNPNVMAKNNTILFMMRPFLLENSERMFHVKHSRFDARQCRVPRGWKRGLASLFHLL